MEHRPPVDGEQAYPDVVGDAPPLLAQVADQARSHGIGEEEVLEKIMLTRAAVRRLIEPEEVAALVAFLVSEEAGMVTGASYTMDGGWTAQ